MTDARYPSMVYCSDATGSLVARCQGTGFETVCRAQDECEANARLTASAPDLMFLARKVAEHFEYTDAPLGILARAVIEKVEAQS